VTLERQAVRGASLGVVRRALSTGDPLPGTRGFAGEVADPPSREGALLVRDVLGRVPLYSEAGDPTTWSHRPGDLEEPRAVPGGHVRSADGDERVWQLPAPEPADDDETALGELADALETALEETATAAVAFSGGVDSALVADAVEGPLYVAGFPESHDVEAARDAARAFDRELRVVELSVDDVERAVPEVAAATGRTNAMDVAIALPLYLVAERAAADGYHRLAVGQGADELFGGYAKVAKAPDDPRVEADTVRGARRETVLGLAEQLPRDVLALEAAGVDPVTPLLDDRVVRAALQLPGHLLVDDRGERKVALRQVANRRVPARVAYRGKKAVQYGSLVNRELDRLARQAGFKRRMDDHVSKYVRSRLTDDRDG
jgi:asparagine synthase (glutamine-hydrolysing)